VACSTQVKSSFIAVSA